MSLFEDMADEMDEAVDATLGDTILYRRAGGEWQTIGGFIIDHNASLFDNGALSSIDELDQRLRIKIRMTTIDIPRDSDRIQATKLGSATWKPSAKYDVAGRYWVADIQKVG